MKGTNSINDSAMLISINNPIRNIIAVPSIRIIIGIIMSTRNAIIINNIIIQVSLIKTARIKALLKFAKE